MKISILWSSLAAYSVAFFRELAKIGDWRLQLIFQPVKTEAPYEDFDLSFCDLALEDTIAARNRLNFLVNEFGPDCVLMNSWCFPHYMSLCKKLRKENVYVISSMDNQWHGSLKQWLGIVSSKLFLKPSIDTFWVTGDRQAVFARKLGFDDLLYGYSAADVNSFKADRSQGEWRRNFLFAGRLVPHKGIYQLLEAYSSYRNSCSNPWELKIVGTGPLKGLVNRITGIRYLGFIQPDQMPSIMEDAGCLVLPSLVENWGVVIHEACASGLPIIASFNCGAITSYLHDGINGFIVAPRAENIADAMVRIASLNDQDLQQMSKVSHQLSRIRHPSILAEYFSSAIKTRIAALNHV